jgi:hypothetical protein
VGAKVFAGRFSEGVLSLVKQTEAVLLQSSAKVFPEPDTGVHYPVNQTTVHRQARLNSRNLLIIATHLHIVNHSALHLREKQVTVLRSQSQV